MINVPFYVQGSDIEYKYRVEFSDDFRVVTVETIARDENGDFKDTGETREFADLKNGWLNVQYETFEAISDYIHDGLKRFEIEGTDANGDVHSFVVENDEMSEYLNGIPVNKILTPCGVYAGCDYAEQMLHIYCDTSDFVTEDTAHDIFFAVYANGSQACVLGYRQDKDGISLVNGDEVCERYDNIDDAINAAKSYVSPETEFDKVCWEFSLDDSNRVFYLHYVAEAGGNKEVCDISYSFDEYCKDEGIEPLDEDKFYEDFAKSHSDFARYDASCNWHYYEGYDEEEEYYNANEEYMKEVYEEERAKFMSAETCEILFEEVESRIGRDLYANLHPADRERINNERSLCKLIPNPAAHKGQTKRKDAITRD